MISLRLNLVGLIFGAMFGGRFGYMLFYGLDQLTSNPLSLFFVWEGGLSFHGGLVGVIVSLYFYSYLHKISFLRLADSICLAMPIGLGFALVELGVVRGDFRWGVLRFPRPEPLQGYLLPPNTVLGAYRF